MATTMMDERVVKSVAGKIARAVAGRDLDALREIYTPDAIIWHNSDDKEKSVEESLAILEMQLRPITRISFEDQKLTPTPNGFVDQHYVRVAPTTGQEVRIPIVSVVTLEGERVKRFEEYIISPAAAARSGGE